VPLDPVPETMGTFYGDENNGGTEFGGIATDLLNNYLVGSTSVSNSSYATSKGTSNYN
jgi:hypothetical protein